jgi:hypothetical protein
MRFLEMAKRKFSTFEGLSQSQAIVDVHNAMTIQIISNDVDWYGILQVNIFFPFYLFHLIIMFTPTLLKF